MAELTNIQLSNGFRQLTQNLDEVRVELGKVMPDLIRQTTTAKNEFVTTLSQLREAVAQIVEE